MKAAMFQDSRESRRVPWVTFERVSRRSPVLIVACVAETPERPHYGIFTRRQVDSIRNLGLACDLMCIAGYRSPLAYARAAGWLAALSLRGEHRYALVHAHGGETGIAASAYWRAPLLISYMGSDLLGAPDENGRNPLRWRIRNAAIQQHSRLTKATITKAAVMTEALPGRVRANNTVIPNGVRRDLFHPLDRLDARRALGWDPQRRTLLFASDPTAPLKRYGLAKAVYARVAEQLDDVDFFVAHGISPAEMPTVMNASDCLLHTAILEGSPNVIKEALACNLPIVATAVGDIPERLDGVTASYVCDGNLESMAAAVLACLDPPRRSNGRDFTDLLSVEQIAERVVFVYREIVGRAVTP
jgi:glycosyltransferase involved in cell wall biosynthesis